MRLAVGETNGVVLFSYKNNVRKMGPFYRRLENVWGLFSPRGIFLGSFCLLDGR